MKEQIQQKLKESEDYLTQLDAARHQVIGRIQTYKELLEPEEVEEPVVEPKKEIKQD